MSLQIVPYGTKVRSIIGNIEMIIIGVVIRNNWMEYHLSYFVGGEHKTCWIGRNEFEIVPAKKKAGFVNYEVDEIDHSKLIETNNEA